MPNTCSLYIPIKYPRLFRRAPRLSNACPQVVQELPKAPESYRTLARRTSRTSTRGDPGQLRACPQAAPKSCKRVTRKLHKGCRAVAPGAEIRPKFGRTKVRIGRSWSMSVAFGQNRRRRRGQHQTKCWSRVATMLCPRTRPKLEPEQGPKRSELAAFGLSLGSRSCDTRECSAPSFGRGLVDPRADHRSLKLDRLGQLWSTRSKFDHKARMWPNSVHFW